MAAIAYHHITHRYETTAVLSDISFEVRKDEILVIIGRSGGGKSTLLQMINGLIVPGKGYIEVFGKRIDYREIRNLRLEIGYAVQGAGLFPHMNVRDNISLLARIQGEGPDEMNSRIGMLMRFVDLDPVYLDKYPHQLSGGEQQRVGICRAMMMNPKIFLLDEPFAALDPATKSEIHHELLALQKAEPRTIVMVTHDLTEALKLADRILILESGVVQQLGTPENIMNYPANEFVAGFIGEQTGHHDA
jgi:osmoprotectant transport system ATP-binding protein